MKKTFSLILALMLVLSLAACGETSDQPNSDSTSTKNPSQSKENTAPVESEDVEPADENEEPTVENEDPSTETDESIKSGRYTLPSGFEINFSTSVRNDVTGKWRISTTADSFVPAEYAVEYYEMLFSSDDEVHAIWNATLSTTTRITVASGIIFADTLEYVKGEEHDANVLFSGMLLDSKMFNADTGEEILID